ncbi:5-amino-6-(5-phospho-D-ribitylamino)uracil phosphatase YigB [Escherichia coli]
MQNYHPALRSFQNEDLQRLRQAVREAEPEIYHDVTRWRFRSIEKSDARRRAECRRSQCRRTRSNDQLCQMAQPNRRPAANSRHLKKQLAKKWPLVAITNGNAQPELFGLGDYFEFVLRAGPHGRSKPFSDMYFLAAEKLNVPIGEILHVGDDLTTDVGGAIRSGMQACWIRPENGDLMQTWDSRLLPHLEISRLASLTSLI